MKTHPTLIVGGGWAGLSAAVELSRHNIPVTLVEAAKQLGGRARSVQQDDKTIVDNGQHLMIGAYHQMLSLLKTTGVDIDNIFHQTQLQIDMLDLKSQSTAFKLKLPRAPAPFHLLFGITNCPSLSFKQKLVTLYRFNNLLNKSIEADINVDEWLARAHLPEAYTEALLKPLCLAALTTHTHEASARAFQSVLQQTFNGPAKNTHLLIPATDLGQVFPQAAKRYIESQGGQVLTEQRVNQITCRDHRATGICINDQSFEIENLILATSARATEKLLTNIKACQPITHQLQQQQYEPVTTVYLQFPESVKLPLPMMGVINATSEWLFDRTHCHQAGLIAVVISANGPHMDLDNAQLAQQVAGELSRLFPDWPEVESSWVIREKRATLRCVPGIDNNRPGIQTPIENLRLCGDYVYIEENNQPGLPSTLEAAMRSGVKCAQQLIQETT